MYKKKIQGFTLIELMFVIAIVGILAGIAIPKVAGVRYKAHDAKISVVSDSIRYSMELYHQENGGYPEDAVGDGESGPANITVDSWSSLNNALDTIELEDKSTYNIGSEHSDINPDDVFSYDVKADGTYEIRLASNTTGKIYIVSPDGYE